jgi:hypothetical protein
MIGDHALNSLTFQHQQVSFMLGHSLSFMLGHSLRSLYEDLLNAPILNSLQTLAAQLEPRTRVESRLQDDLLPKHQ